MSLSDDQLGWFYIGETWNLYIDGDLTEVHVEYINVDEKPEGEGYLVKHFDRAGELLTAESLEADDIAPVLGDREPTDRPQHI